MMSEYTILGISPTYKRVPIRLVYKSPNSPIRFRFHKNDVAWCTPTDDQRQYSVHVGLKIHARLSEQLYIDCSVYGAYQELPSAGDLPIHGRKPVEQGCSLPKYHVLRSSVVGVEKIKRQNSGHDHPSTRRPRIGKSSSSARQKAGARI